MSVCFPGSLPAYSRMQLLLSLIVLCYAVIYVCSDVSACKWFGANQILRHSSFNAVILTGLLGGGVLCHVSE